MIQAVLSNPSHPEYGVATIPFPIPRDQYARCMELLEALEIGDAVKADCKVEKVDSFYTVLKRVEMLTVNVEKLNYLAKRLDSFDTGEAAQFQAMAHKLELFELKDLINLTFCCQQATVITDFSDLAAVGRDHYMNLHGGSASVDELNALDGKGTARQLIESDSGKITPYGVVYDNGMKLEQIYDGRFFPCYYYEPNAITVAVTSKSEPEDTNHITWLYLPMEQEEIDRALLRGGITDPSEIRLRLEDSWLPHEVLDLLDMDHVDIRDEMLRMTLRVEGKPDYTLVLPADEEYLDAVKNYLDIDVFADAMLCDIRFKVPYIGELIRDTDCPAVEDYNDFAEALEDIWQKDGMLLTYAAVLEAENPKTLHRACELLQDLDNYQRITEDAYGYGQQRLQETLGLDDEAIYELDGYMDFEKYGQDCMENDCVTKTEFGLLRRLEPPFPEQRQGQRMM